MWQIPKILKILISVLVAVSMALTPFAGMGFNVRSEAVAPLIIEVLKEVALQVIKGAVYGMIGSATAFGVQEVSEIVNEVEYSQTAALGAISSENGVYLDIGYTDSSGNFYGAKYDENGNVLLDTVGEYEVHASLGDISGLTAEEQEFATFFVDYVNKNPISVCEWNGDVNNALLSGDQITVQGYESVKTVVTNAYSEYMLEKMAENETINNVTNLREALNGNYAGPAYNFDFVGPTPTLELPMLNSYGSYDDGGFFFSQPITVTNYDGSTLIKLTEEQCAALSCVGQTSYKANSSGQYFFTYAKNCYGGSPYVLYDGKIFYAPTASAGSSAANYSCSLTEQFSSLGSFKAVDGSTLADYGLTKEWLQAGTNALQIGYILNLSNNTNYDTPLEAYQAGTMSAVTGDSFSKTTGGAVSIPHTMAEQIIGQAEKLGLLNSDSLLSLDSTGEIAAADDITIAKLQELCQLMADGNLQFESVQEYLDLITQLVSSGNVTAKAQETILSNVEKYAKTQAKDVAEIKAAVKSLTDVKELEKEDIELDAIIVEHTGLAEAEALVKSALPIVEQSKQLITNVLNQAEAAPDYVPNFSFYWDSNKDGITEKYTALDLSFMETTLTNDNLEDKNRFEKPMTVKEFVQALIVFIVYVIFAVKLLRRIPGFLGGSESVSDDIKTFNTKKGN